MTADEARALFTYDPATGGLRWRVRAARCVTVGDDAGSIKQDGYRSVTFRRKTYPAHRIAWAITYGEWPANILDHINGDRQDNRIANLRLADVALNAQNQRRAHRGNLSSGILGVHYYRRTGRWRATICVNGKNQYLGYYATAEEAQAVYIAAKRRLHGGCTV